VAQLETTLTNQIRRAIEASFPKDENGFSEAWGLKVAGGGYQNAGVPDLLYLIRGTLFGFEVKAQRSGESKEHARNRATLRQLIEIDKINRAGGCALVVISVDEVMSAIWNNLT